MDRESVVQEIRRVAAELRATRLSRSEFKSRSNVSEWQIYKYFDSWNEAVQAAGLVPTGVSRIDDSELFREMKNVFVKFGGVCTRMKFDRLCRYSADVYKKRFGRWNNVLSQFRAWLEESGEAFPFLSQLPSVGELPKAKETVPDGKEKRKPVSWGSLGAMTYGSFLNFRGLQHAPVNEQGVVFLFGMVCFELGFAVEAIRTSYPDCEAKRRVNRKRDEWERVRIEFEYCSGHFRDHGHNPKDCDVIVCWQHDWPECPLEVIELKTAIQLLSE